MNFFRGNKGRKKDYLGEFSLPHHRIVLYFFVFKDVVEFCHIGRIVLFLRNKSIDTKNNGFFQMLLMSSYVQA